jgi:hypothetical protein
MRSTILLAVLLVSSFASADVTVGAQLSGNTPTTVSADDPFAARATQSVDASNVTQGPGSYAAAAADLTAGTLRVLATGSIVPGFATQQYLPVATAVLGDTITVNGSGSTATVTFTLDVGGTITVQTSEPDRQALIQMEAGMSYNNITLAGYINRTIDSGDGGAPSDVTMEGPTDPNIQFGAEGFTVQIQTTVSVGQAIPFAAHLFANASTAQDGIVATTDYGNTARVAVTLPPGYTLSSQSGSFLVNSGGSGLLLDGGGYLPPDAGGVTGEDAGDSDGGIVTGEDAGGSDAGSVSGEDAGGGGDGGSLAGADGGNGGKSSGGCTTGGGFPTLVGMSLVSLLFAASRRARPVTSAPARRSRARRGSRPTA